MASFQDRVVGALKLQAATFEEVEADKTATAQAAIIVLAASVSNGLGLIRWWGLSGTLRQALFALAAWALGAAVIWLIGTRVLPGKNTQADWTDLLRCLGFAQAPGLFSVLYIVPLVGGIVPFVVVIWTLIAAVIAVKAALDYDDTMKAVIVCVLGWVAMAVALSILGGAALGMGMVPGRVF
jgi:hypothetical protein